MLSESTRNQQATRLIAYVAVLTALAVLIRRFLTPQIYGLNLGGFPLILSGLVIGPVGGAYVGALSDIIGMYLAPHGTFNPFYTATAMLTASVPALVLGALRRFNQRRSSDLPRYWELLVAILVGQLLTKAILIPLFRHWMTNLPYLGLSAWGALEQLIHAPLYAFLALAVLRALPSRLLVPAPSRLGGRALV